MPPRVGVLASVLLLGCAQGVARRPVARAPRAGLLVPHPRTAPDPVGERARALIDALADISEEGVGYSGAYGGTEFLPYPGEEEPGGSLLLMRAPPAPSSELQSLVAMGADAVPALVECLADARPTRIAPIHAIMWMRFSDE